MQVQLKVNGKAQTIDVAPNTLLVQALRENLKLTGTHVGCDTAQCGACTVHINGRAVKSCNMLAVQANGAEITTIEGMAQADGTMHPMQAAFKDCHGLQCGFCTPGMVMSAVDLCKHHPKASEGEIRELLEGNLCRCTGYQNIVKAVQQGAAAMANRLRRTDMGAPDFANLPHIGEAIKRKEDYRFLTGAGQYTDDIKQVDQTYAVFVRSPHAHANIKGIDLTKAKAMPGVVEIFTGKDIDGKMGGLPCGWLITSTDGTPMKEPPHPILAMGKVRYVGDQVAMVIAETLEQAKNAAEAVDVDYDVLSAVVVGAPTPPRRAALHDAAPDNHCYKWAIGDKGAGGCGVCQGRARHQARPHQQPSGAQRHGAARGHWHRTAAPPRNTRCTCPTRTRTSSAC